MAHLYICFVCWGQQQQEQPSDVCMNLLRWFQAMQSILTLLWDLHLK